MNFHRLWTSIGIYIATATFIVLGVSIGLAISYGVGWLLFHNDPSVDPIGCLIFGFLITAGVCFGIVLPIDCIYEDDKNHKNCKSPKKGKK